MISKESIPSEIREYCDQHGNGYKIIRIDDLKGYRTSCGIKAYPTMSNFDDNTIEYLHALAYEWVIIELYPDGPDDGGLPEISNMAVRWKKPLGGISAGFAYQVDASNGSLRPDYRENDFNGWDTYESE